MGGTKVALQQLAQQPPTFALDAGPGHWVLIPGMLTARRSPLVAGWLLDEGDAPGIGPTNAPRFRVARLSAVTRRTVRQMRGAVADGSARICRLDAHLAPLPAAGAEE